MNDDIYIFFHLTKTAGTSLRAILYYFYTGGEWRLNESIVYPYYGKVEGISYTRPLVLDERAYKAKYFIGHLVYYGMHEDIGKPAKYVVFLRDPLERFTSLFNHVRVDPEHKTVIDFKTWFDRYKHSTMVNELVAGSKFTGTSLDQAKNILKNSFFVGLQETFNQDIKQLFYPNVNDFHRNITEENAKKVGVTPIKFSKEEVKTVMEVLNEDTQLYQYAFELRKTGHNNGFELPFDPSYEI